MWVWCDKGEAIDATKAVAKQFIDIGRQQLSNDESRGSSLIKHGIKSHDLKRIEAMLKLAASEPGMTVSINELDSDPWLLGVRNGVVNLKTGTLLANDPSMLITRVCNASHDHTATCPRWLTFLDQVFDGDLDTIDSVQRALGYTLTGFTSEEVLFICFGHGSNGKSVFNNVVANILGSYGRVAPPSLLTLRRNGDSSPRNDLAALAGARYVSINELQSGDRLDEQVVKLLAGREMISARFLHKEFFEFVPTFTPWLRTNHKPVITGDDDGIWRRLVLIPFRQQFSGQAKDPNLEHKLMEEQDGILGWMVDGAVKWQRDGLNLSPTIWSEGTSYRKDSDLLGQFLGEVCITDPNESVLQADLYRQYRAWTQVNGIGAIAKASFTRRLAERGYTEKKSNSKYFYRGLKINHMFPLPLSLF
jgi:putative DNA primase/helicase